jgi:hypothetical protein
VRNNGKRGKIEIINEITYENDCNNVALIDQNIKDLDRYVIGTKEYRAVKWHDKLDMLKKFIDEHDRKPKEKAVDITEKMLYIWFNTQKSNYNKQIFTMSNVDFYNSWTIFIEKYKQYFLYGQSGWYNMMEKVKKFINQYKKKPNKRSLDKDEKTIAIWLSTQSINYRKKEFIMKHDDIYNAWTEFTTVNYKLYFLTPETTWNNVLCDVREYIIKHGRRPRTPSLDKDEKEKVLGNWVFSQRLNYKDRLGMMINNDIYDIWTKFTTIEYPILFISKEDLWFESFKKVKKFTEKYNKKPNKRSLISSEKVLGEWISTQQKCVNDRVRIMSNDEIYNTWTEFCLSL